MKVLKTVGLGVIISLLVMAILAILVIVDVLNSREGLDVLSKSLAVIGICVATLLAVTGVSRLISD